MSDLIGQTIDRYQILEQLGQGGMATVYLAFDARLERKVAVKVIRQNAFPPTMMEKILKRFEREAKALAKLNHPNIVGVIDYGNFEGAPYLVMPFIPSGTLKEKLGKTFHYSDAAKILAPIARALAYAHDEEIVHRDVKPSNILITRSGDPVLTDFGIAKLLEEVEGNTLTGTGIGLGTPEYMAPEQWHGKADASSDQYALGVIFYEMITGQKPFTADTPIAVMLKQATEPLPIPRKIVSDLPEKIEFMILKMIAKNPNNRYSGMGKVAITLEKVAQTIQIDNNLVHEIEEEDINLYGANNNNNETHYSYDETLDLKTGYGEEKTSVDSNIGSINQNQIKQKHEVFPINPGKSRKKFIYSLIGVIGIISLIVLLVYLSNLFSKFKGSIFSVDTLQTNTTINSFSETIVPTLKPLTTNENKPSLISNIDGMELVFVPAGTFIMGSQNSDGNRFNELPAHEVYMDSYWIDKYEVNNLQFSIFIDKSGYKTDAENALCSYVSDGITWTCDEGVNWQKPTGTENEIELLKDHPVVQVSWNDAKAYCLWAGRDLPTEAQWEKAAKGNDGRLYPWGNEAPNKELANINNNIGITTPVGSYPAGASPYGVMDMAGNVREWANDWYEEDYYSRVYSRWENPKGPPSGTEKVTRGGSWAFDTSDLLTTLRGRSYPTYSENLYGFRCAIADSEELTQSSKPIITPTLDSPVTMTDYSTANIFLESRYIEGLTSIDIDLDHQDELVVLSNLDGTDHNGLLTVYKWSGTDFSVFWQTGLIEGYPYGLKTCDINSDGYQDILLSINGLRLISNNDGILVDKGILIDNFPDETFICEDLNEDGFSDIVFGGPGADSGNIQVYEQLSQSNLQSPMFVNRGFLPGTVGNNLVKPFRFYKTGKVGILGGEFYSGDVFVYKNGEDFDFSSTLFEYSFDERIFGIETSDFNNDGFEDFVISKAWDKLYFFNNLSDQGFDIQPLGNTSGSFFKIMAYDLNIDSKTDIIASEFEGNVFWFENLGESKFQEHLSVIKSDNNYGLSIGDFNGDGLVDIAFGKNPVIIVFNAYKSFE